MWKFYKNYWFYIYSFCYVFLGNENCCFGFFLCVLVMLNKLWWEKVIIGVFDLFFKGLIDL